MAKKLSEAAREALREKDWRRVDAMTNADIARQIAAHADAAPDMAPDIDVRAIREAIGMTQVEIAAAYEFSVRTVQEWERGAKRPSGPARTLLRAIKGDPEGLRKGVGDRVEKIRSALPPTLSAGRIAGRPCSTARSSPG